MLFPKQKSFLFFMGSVMTIDEIINELKKYDWLAGWVKQHKEYQRWLATLK
jgi:Na+/H+ antiporter NhaD/arsenite permease-like protein